MWDGYSDVELPPPSEHVPRLNGPGRDYSLLQGSLADFAGWETVLGTDDPPPPAFVWPADRRWCFASDVDPHWAGVGGSSEAIGALCREAELEVVVTDPSADQPEY